MKQWFFTALFLASTGVVFAAEPFEPERKSEQRLLFNRYYEEQLAAAREKTGEDKAWHLVLSSSYGNDGNASLEDPRVSDKFFRQDVEFDWARPHDGLGFLGAGEWGVEADANYLTYHEETESDFSTHAAGPFVEFSLPLGLSIRERYAFSYVHYPQDEDLRYYGHLIESTLTHRVCKSFSHSIYHEFEFKDFTDRNALSAQNTGLSKERDDLYHELGYAPRVDFERAAIGGSIAYKRNHSNDVYRDYNDYAAWAVSGFVYEEILPRLWIVGIGGFEYKKYQARTFFDFPRDRDNKPERDHYVYAGASVYFAVQKNVTFNVSYLYTRNRSNDPDLIYFGNTVTAGLTFAL